jgi:hypothetical protein
MGDTTLQAIGDRTHHPRGPAEEKQPPEMDSPLSAGTKLIEA